MRIIILIFILISFYRCDTNTQSTAVNSSDSMKTVTIRGVEWMKHDLNASTVPSADWTHSLSSVAKFSRTSDICRQTYGDEWRLPTKDEFATLAYSENISPRWSDTLYSKLLVSDSPPRRVKKYYLQVTSQTGDTIEFPLKGGDDRMKYTTRYLTRDDQQRKDKVTVFFIDISVPGGIWYYELRYINTFAVRCVKAQPPQIDSTLNNNK